MIPKIKLNNGVEIPQLGFGTFKIEDGKPVIDAVTTALETGYRHIDTAAVYKNEDGVGTALHESGIRRDELFVTTKLWNRDQGYDSALRAFDESMKKLKLDFVDLYLIHWPTDMELISESWRALERLYKDGVVRAIGVSNFKEHHLKPILENCEVRPAANQVEFHLTLQQDQLLQYCNQQDIAIEAWSPLMQGTFGDIELVNQLADKYGKTPAQIILRWDIQKQVITIPKSVTPSRIKENFDIFDFVLSNEDMALLGQLNTETRIGPDPDDYKKK
nr:aldo/keto reductase [Culicoidibacter larvae]